MGEASEVAVKKLRHNRLKNLISESKRLGDFSQIEAFVPSNEGYVLTADMRRIMFRIYRGHRPVDAIRADRSELGRDLDGITDKEAFALISRLRALPEIEQIALDLQREHHLLRNLLIDIHAALSRKETPDSKLIVKAAMLIRDTSDG